MCRNSALKILRIGDVRLLALPAPTEKRVSCFVVMVDRVQKLGDMIAARMYLILNFLAFLARNM